MRPASPAFVPRPLPDGYRFVPLDDRRWRDVADLDTWVFPLGASTDEHASEANPLTWERTVGIVGPGGVEDGLAAQHTSFPFARFPVPGARLASAGLSWVGVHPQHRRRGLASAMIDHHFAACLARNEALSVLYASEYPLYGRYGYGRGCDDVRLQIPRGARLLDVPGADRHTVRLEHASQERHGDMVARLHAAAGDDVVAGLNRPGWAERETLPMQDLWWDDPEHLRGGFETRRIVVVELDGEPRGYATFRRKIVWDADGVQGPVQVGEAVALDAAAARALWGVLLELDLAGEVLPYLLPADDVVLSLLADRRAARPRLVDNLWVRLVDVRTALGGRRYAADVDAVIGVHDRRLPHNEGAWHVRGAAFGPATCEPTQAPPDLELDVRELGSVYLGAGSLAALATAGLVTERTPGALARVGTAFGWPVAPGASWFF
ncbi:GNAT family N-acetyltransferase [Xylanimonas allomyrinae]|uniref:GNAT family N-acetyltransferase n=1 Tax=Xylanimonas allomyrinae TaxID=2509459 RepID=A0A4P6ELQ2_9MICO|nr:GNAT family N-acetyltransferase [Xylanimonas allomyrinae]QAY62199.1 GNAT family N-acetyltransferase [Xylanimonas allomyrinae]